MTVVVDVGCASWDSPYHDSVGMLVDRFHPDMLLGLDPAVDEDRDSVLGTTRVMLRKRAAWINDGTIPFLVDGLDGRVTSDDGATPVECVDIAGVMAALERPVIMKLDCEGSEYPILERLIATGLLPDRLLVEWHRFDDGSHEPRKRLIEDSLDCEVEEWEF